MPQKSKNDSIIQKQDYLDCGNYRPISLLNCLSKVYESVLYKRIYKRMSKNLFVTKNLFTQRESGFRSPVHTLEDK